MAARRRVVIPACPLSGTLPHIVGCLGVDETTSLRQSRCAGWGRVVARPPRPVVLLRPVRPSHGMTSSCDVHLHNWGSVAPRTCTEQHSASASQSRTANGSIDGAYQDVVKARSANTRD